MKLLFLDNSEISSDRISVNSLGGFIVDSQDYVQISQEFRELKAQYGMPVDTPVKWSPGSNDARYLTFRALPNLNQFRRDALGIIAAHDVKLLCCFINNDLEEIRRLKRLRRITRGEYKGFLRRYNKQAMEYAVQRFQREIAGGDEYGQVIIEFNSDAEMNSAIGEHYRRIRTSGTGRPFFNMQLSNLADGLFFSHDFCCDGLEVADFIVSSLTHAVRSSHYEYVDIIRGKIRSAAGQSKGYGIVVYPSSSTVVDNLVRRVDA